MKKPSFIALVYVQQFFSEFMPIYPLYALMFSEQGGLSNSEISLLFMAWVIFALLSEVPTGIIADKFSRKNALIYSYLLQGVSFLIWLAMPHFWGYLLGFLTWGIGYAFSSGTFQAYLYEELKASGSNASFNKVFARSQSLKLTGMVAAYILASLVGAKNYTAALLISVGVSFGASAIVLLFPYKSKRQIAASHISSDYWSILRAATHEVRHSKKAVVFVVAVGILTGIVGSMEEFTPLFYHGIGFSAEAIPLLLGGGLLISSLLGWFAHRMERLPFAIVASILIIASLCMLGAAISFSLWLGLAGMMVFMRLIMLCQTLFSASLQHTIRDEQRATIGSLASFIGQLIAIGILIVTSILFTTVGEARTYQALALGFILAGVLLALIGKRRTVGPGHIDDATLPPGRPV